jgi:hypothetical protein
MKKTIAPSEHVRLEAALASPPPTECTGAGRAHRPDTIHLVIVDADPVLRDAVASLLSRAVLPDGLPALRVSKAAGPAEAAALLRSGEVAYLVTSISSPNTGEIRSGDPPRRR